MIPPIKIGITGGIGSGKTLVSDLFMQLGAPVYFADDRAKYLMNTKSEIKIPIIKLLGKQAYTAAGLNRKYVAQKVFTNKTLITQLNSIVHPLVFNDFANWAQVQQHQPYLLKEAALLFESGSYLELDAIITVDAPENIRINRVMQRDGATRKEVENRMRNQLSSLIKTKAADYVITNNGHTPILPQVLQLHQQFLIS
jgi:dephospho-CoA kinase